MAESTFRTYKSILYKFVSLFEQEIVTDKEIIRVFQQHISQIKKNHTNNYAVLTGRVIRGFLSYNNFEEMNKIPVPKKEKVIREALSKNEVEELLNACIDDWEYSLIYILLNTGLRVSELTNMKREDIREYTIHVHNGKGGKDRIIPITCDTYNICQNICGKTYLFENRKGNKVSTRHIQMCVQIIHSRTSITRSVSPHVLRHTYATQLSRDGLDVTVIQQLLGHTNLSTTQMYINLSWQDINQAFHDVRGV